MFVTGLVLAAGSSTRLGEPKQLLPFGDGTLLGASLDRARECGFDQLLVTVGAAGDDVRTAVDLSGAEVVESTERAAGCSSSIRSALAVVDPRADGLVLLLGDQPGVQAASVQRLLAESASSPLGVCRYSDGRGHPIWLGRAVFPSLELLHGDKGVWKLLESGQYAVTEVDVPGEIPLDVDTREDYERLLARDTMPSEQRSLPNNGARKGVELRTP